MANLYAALNWLVFVRLAITLLTVFLAWVTYRSHLLLKQFQPNFNLLLSPAETIARLVLVGLCLALAWLSGLPAVELGLAVDRLLFSVAVGLVIGVLLELFINWLTTWAIDRFGRHIYSPLVVRNILPRRPVEWIWVPLAFIPAVVMEELLFRSLWLGVFRPVIPLPLLIVGTSVVFGFMHQPQGRLGVIISAGINVVFCLMFVWWGDLWAPLVAHYTVNLLQLIMAYHQRDWLENYF